MKFRNNISVERYFIKALETIEENSFLLDIFNRLLLNKDLYAHSCGVAEVYIQLSLSLGLSTDSLVAYTIAALFHDIGKLEIPDEILNKTGKLSDEDIKIIRKHPEAGFNILKSSGMSAECLNLVLLHHETLDGTGYPKGYSDLPFEVQVLTVSDIFNALTESRCYRSALPIDDALGYMKRINNINQDVVSVLAEAFESS